MPLLGSIQGFTYPRMGGTQGDEVTFGEYSDSGEAVAVYDSMGKGFIDGINETTIDDQGNALLGFGTFSLSSGNHPVQGSAVTAFISSVSGADGVFVRLPSGQVVTVATTLTNSPSGSVYNFLSNPAVDVSEDATTIFVTFEARAGSVWRGIMLGRIPVSYSGLESIELVTVADTSTLIPGTDIVYKCLSAPVTSPQGQVIFFGSHCGSTGSSLMVQSQWNQLAIYDGLSVTQHALTRDRSVGVAATNSGIWRWNSGTLEAVADDTVDVPGGNTGERFVAFSNPGIGVDGTTAFVGLGDNVSYGIFRQRLGQPLERVVGRQDDVPGYTGCKFANFPQPPSVGEKGDVVFFGQCSSEVAGVFYEAGSTLGTLINYDDKIEGVGLTYVGFGTNAYSANKVGMYVLLENGTNGIWSFDVPSGETVAV